MAHQDIHYLDPGEEKILVDMTIVLSFFSLLGSAFIIFVYYYFVQIRNFAFKLITYLSMADFLFAFSKFLIIFNTERIRSKNFSCILQAFVVNFSGLSSIIWTTVISHTLKRTLLKEDFTIYSKEYKYLAVGFGIPFLMSLIPIFNDSYGPTGCWCWIELKDDSFLPVHTMRFIEFYIPLLIAIYYNFKVYIQVVAFLKAYCERDFNRFLIRRLRLYPMILVICWIWACINRVYNFFGKELFLLNFLHILFGSLHGFFNACVYGLTKSVRVTVKEFLVEKCCAKQADETDPNYDLIREFKSASAIERRYPKEVELIEYYT